MAFNMQTAHRNIYFPGIKEVFESIRDPTVYWSGVLYTLQKLFDACERDIEKRKTGILEILGFPSSYDAANTCKQVLHIFV